MNAAERRTEIIRLLYKRKHITIGALAKEFEVSERTIRRDIDSIGTNVELDIKAGRYGGGIYISKSDTTGSRHLTINEEDVIMKIIKCSQENIPYQLTQDELNTLKQLLITHTSHQLNIERI